MQRPPRNIQEFVVSKVVEYMKQRDDEVNWLKRKIETYDEIICTLSDYSQTNFCNREYCNAARSINCESMRTCVDCQNWFCNRCEDIRCCTICKD